MSTPSSVHGAGPVSTRPVDVGLPTAGLPTAETGVPGGGESSADGAELTDVLERLDSLEVLAAELDARLDADVDPGPPA